jgi:NAD(P)H dehydrogenase (quinone)
MSIVVTGATGHLGRLAIAGLISRGIPAADIVAAGRNVDKLAALEPLGVRTVAIDLSVPETLDAAFAGADTVLLVSASEPGSRVALHKNAIDAAKRAGVSRVVYTSAPHADTTTLVLAPEHRATEELLVDSGLGYTILRNGWYSENYAGSLAQARSTGQILASVGDGRVASAARVDYADAAVAVIVEDGHDGAIYELSGDVAWNFDEQAATFATVLGRDVTYVRLTPEDHLERLVAAGLDAATAGFVVALDGNIRDGDLAETSGDLAKLIGRPTTPFIETIRELA